jgi:hypothetical protein
MLSEGMKAEDMPQVPPIYMQRPDRQLNDLRAGEPAVIDTLLAVRVDKECHAWIDEQSAVVKGGHVPGMTSQVERTEIGFILWLDRHTRFQPQEFSPRKGWTPVVEFRELEDRE